MAPELSRLIRGVTFALLVLASTATEIAAVDTRPVAVSLALAWLWIALAAGLGWLAGVLWPCTFAPGPRPETMSSAKSSIAGYSDSSTMRLRRWISSMKITSRVAKTVSMLASAPCLELNIGRRNIETAQANLTKLNLKIRGQAVGGTDGRTMRLYLADGRTTVRVAGGAERVIVNADLDPANLRDQGVI